MRIIAGEFRGRKIGQPPLDKARPTKDRIRESVFNMIASEVPGARVLDLFSGSGAYGLEALSRGAEYCEFVENCLECREVIESNIEHLSLSGRARLINADALRYIENMGQDDAKFDIIFSDPPYGCGESRNILIMINQYDILSSFGTLVLEHSSREDLPAKEGGVSIYKQKTYNNISISIFRKK
jgi:16S rRNA (guanine966-N2)-methyltransferase